MSNALSTLPTTSDVERWSLEEKAVVEAAGLVFTHTYGDRSGQKEPAPRPVVAQFLHTCQRTGLDPLARQIYCIGRFSRGQVEWSIQTAIDGFRVIAERSGKYAGQDAAEWLTEKGEWVPAFIKSVHGDRPLAARVAVYRSDWHHDKPAVGIATWDEYAQTKRDGSRTEMWRQRGPGQLAKCAEALALRKAFPNDLSGLYADDEMTNAVVDVPVPEEQTDWAALIEAVGSRAELDAIAERLKSEPDSVRESIRPTWQARAGVLAREAETVEAEIVEGDPAAPSGGDS